MVDQNAKELQEVCVPRSQCDKCVSTGWNRKDFSLDGKCCLDKVKSSSNILTYFKVSVERGKGRKVCKSCFGNYLIGVIPKADYVYILSKRLKTGRIRYQN